jgi:hypothetical protein
MEVHHYTKGLFDSVLILTAYICIILFNVTISTMFWTPKCSFSPNKNYISIYCFCNAVLRFIPFSLFLI